MKLFASIAIIGVSAWVLFAPVMAMHVSDHSVGCLATLGGIPCLSSAGVLSHLQAIQNVLLASEQPTDALMLVLLAAMLFAYAVISSATNRTNPFSGLRLVFDRQAFFSPSRLPILSWQSRLQHSPTVM